jgi:hypothetical protein
LKGRPQGGRIAWPPAELSRFVAPTANYHTIVLRSTADGPCVPPPWVQTVRSHQILCLADNAAATEFSLERFSTSGVLHLTMEGRRGAYRHQSALSVLRRNAGI